MSREWRLYLSDLIEFCERVVQYTEGLTRDAFEADQMRYDATLRNIELIGEAVRQTRGLTPGRPLHRHRAGRRGSPSSIFFEQIAVVDWREAGGRNGEKISFLSDSKG